MISPKKAKQLKTRIPKHHSVSMETDLHLVN